MKLIRRTWMCVFALPIATTSIGHAADIVLPIETSAVILPGTPATTTSASMPMTTRPVPASTTPSGRLPQYQLGPAQLVKSSKPESKDTIRFMLSMPDGPLLVEAIVTIDGKPYLTARESRVTELLTQQASETSVDTTELVGRLRRYREATGHALTADEIDWWLTTAFEGPVVLWLKEGFQRFRADQRPVFTILDRNHDGTVDAAELTRAEESLLTTDVNRNDIVEFTELGNATKEKAASISTTALPRMSIESDQSSLAPDLRLKINFQSAQPAESRLRLMQISGSAKTRVRAVNAEPTRITMRIDGVPVMLEAVQVAGLITDQISLGSVNDGYPWLPALDLNDDGRLTVRERRPLQTQLATFDINQDGSLTTEEAIAPFRVAIGLGPVVHRHLANIRSIQPRPSAPSQAGPEWFVRMDRNKDQDLTRAEFPGTDEQFRAMDRDDDQLIDVAEALASEQPVQP